MIGERIKKLRLEQNISQNQLAKKARISQAGLSAIENTTKSPNIETIKAIANALNTTIDYLLGNDDYTPSPQIDAHLPGRDTAKDGFTFAMQNEYPDLTQEDVEILKNIARQLNVAREKQERK